MNTIETLVNQFGTKKVAEITLDDQIYVFRVAKSIFNPLSSFSRHDSRYHVAKETTWSEICYYYERDLEDIGLLK